MSTEPMIWMQNEETLVTADCGCLLSRDHCGSGDPAVILCPLHAAAPELAEALADLVGSLQSDASIQEVAQKMEAARAALRKAGING